jgi:hypothetical protein
MPQASIKISTFTHSVLKDVKELTGKSITRIVEDLVKAEYPAKYKKGNRECKNLKK